MQAVSRLSFAVGPHDSLYFTLAMNNDAFRNTDAWPPAPSNRPFPTLPDRRAEFRAKMKDRVLLFVVALVACAVIGALSLLPHARYYWHLLIAVYFVGLVIGKCRSLWRNHRQRRR